MIFLAPLQGYTECTFRNAFHMHFNGIDAAVSPFIPLVEGKKIKPWHLRDILPENNHGMHLIPQVMGIDASQFKVMAKELYELGYDEINWNIGCPVKAIARKKRGSGILPFPSLVESILETVIPNIPNRLSLKTRLGYNDPLEFYELVPVFNKFPLDKIFIHPRIGKQMYEGNLHLGIFSECFAELKHKIVFNGDISNLDTFQALKRQFPGISDWMIGRGIFNDLFLPSKINGDVIPGFQKAAIFRDFHDKLVENLKLSMIAEKHILNKLKEYWQHFKNMFAEGENFFDKIKLAEILDDMLKQTDTFLNTNMSMALDM